MVEFKAKYDKELIKEIEVSGHASNNYGNDIVCASISTAIIVTVNAIETLSLSECIKFKLEDGYFKLNVISDNQTVNLLLENLMYTLHELKNEYPKKINKKE